MVDHDPEAIAPEDELLLHTKHTLPDNVKRYWKKRYLLFSRFDDGVYMLLELWYSVTPEAVAQFTAKLISELVGGSGTVVDVCCGGGGNTIQFARYFDRVVAIDINPVNITCTAHNCQVYQVAANVELITGDWRQLSQQLSQQFHQPQFMFCLPPWGGTEYNRTADGFDVDAMTPFGLPWLVASLLKHAPSCGVFLPRNSNMAQLQRQAEEYGGGRVVYLYLDNHCVGLLALYGAICELDWQYHDVFVEPEALEDGADDDDVGDDSHHHPILSY